MVKLGRPSKKDLLKRRVIKRSVWVVAGILIGVGLAFLAYLSWILAR